MNNSDFTILLIDTDTNAIASLQHTLEREEYNVIICSNTMDAKQLILEENPQLIILELLLPKLNGIELCSSLHTEHTFGETLIVFYTAQDDDQSQIAAFNAGADDYIIKPQKQKVLISRIKALLKRHPQNKHKKIVRGNSTKNIVIDRERYLVFVDGEEIVLPRKEFELLALLSASPSRVFTRKEISERIWGYDFVAKNRTIDVHVLKIREKLGEGYIKTIKGVGYSFDEN